MTYIEMRDAYQAGLTSGITPFLVVIRCRYCRKPHTVKPEHNDCCPDLMEWLEDHDA